MLPLTGERTQQHVVPTSMSNREGSPRWTWIDQIRAVLAECTKTAISDWQKCKFSVPMRQRGMPLIWVGSSAFVVQFSTSTRCTMPPHMVLLGQLQFTS